jgi:hypothetical protein
MQSGVLRWRICRSRKATPSKCSLSAGTRLNRRSWAPLLTFAHLLSPVFGQIVRTSPIVGILPAPSESKLSTATNDHAPSRYGRDGRHHEGIGSGSTVARSEATVALPGFVVMELIQGCDSREEQDLLLRKIDQFRTIWPTSENALCYMSRVRVPLFKPQKGATSSSQT